MRSGVRNDGERFGVASRAPLLAGLALLLLAAPLAAGALPDTGALLPAPRSLVLRGGTVRLGPGCLVVSDHGTDDAFAVGLVRASLFSASQVSPAAGPGTTSLRKVVFRSGTPRTIPTGSVAEQCYELVVAGDSVVIQGPTAAARLYGATTLRQLVQAGGGLLPSCSITDGPALRTRGLSLDVSRGRMPSRAEFVRVLDVCAGFKLNMVQLYIEDVFPFRGVPGDAIRPCSVSPGELRVIAAEARRRSISLVPIVETLGHQERMLSHLSMRNYSELNAPHSGWERFERSVRLSIAGWLERIGIHASPALQPSGMFAVADPRTQALVQSMLDDVVEASGSSDVHIGCDEATELGRGASANAAMRGGSAALYLDHIRRLASRAQSRWGATAWLYDDFLLQHPDLFGRLPANTVLVDWHYDPAARFGSLDSLSGFDPKRVVTSAGLWNWFSVYPAYARAFPNIRIATAAAQSHGCRGSLLASWGDGGAEDLFGNDVFGVAYFADRAWSPAADEPRDFIAAYCRVRFGQSAPAALPAYRTLAQLELPNGSNDRRLVYHPVLVRSRTAEWIAAIRELDTRLAGARSQLAQVQPLDVYADAELEALSSSVARLLAATGREITLDSLASDIRASGSGSASAGGRVVASLTRLSAVHADAERRYGAAWRAHNLESGLPEILARMRRQGAVLDSLRRTAEAGRLSIPVRYRSAG